MSDLSVFSKRVREVRGEKTLRAFAELVGCTATTLSAYESGQKNPSLEIVKGIAEKCEVSIDWLCGLSEEKNINNEPQTYADVLRLLIAIERKIYLEVQYNEDVIQSNPPSVFFRDSIMQDFLNDWNEILPLVKKGTIDKKLYRLWCEDKIREYEIVIGDHEGMREFYGVRDAINYSLYGSDEHGSDENP